MARQQDRPHFGPTGRGAGRKEGSKKKKKRSNNEVYGLTRGQSGFAAELSGGEDIGVSTVIKLNFHRTL